MTLVAAAAVGKPGGRLTGAQVFSPFFAFPRPLAGSWLESGPTGT